MIAYDKYDEVSTTTNEIRINNPFSPLAVFSFVTFGLTIIAFAKNETKKITHSMECISELSFRHSLHKKQVQTMKIKNTK